VGETIIFLNIDDVAHIFTSGIPSDDVIGTEFNSGTVSPGDAFTWIPQNVGEFSYFDMTHPWMQGLIVVEPTVETTSPTIITLDSIPSSIPLDYGPFLIRGSLTDSNGIPISGKPVWMQANSDDGSGQGGDAITDSNGYFIGNWDVYVYFESDADYDFSSSTSRYITVEPTVTTVPITISTNKSTYEDGDFLLVSGTATPNEELEIILFDYTENVVTREFITVDSSGSYSTSLETFDSTYMVFGEYGVLAASHTDDRYNVVYFEFIDTTPVVTIVSTNITLNNVVNDNYNSPFFVTGTLTTIDGIALSGKPVWLQVENTNGEYISVETVTDSDGYFESVMYFSSGDQGNWCVNAGFDGDNIFLPSSTDLYSRVCFTITGPIVSITPTLITLDSIPSSIPLDYGPFMVTGKLTTTDGTPLSGKSIWMQANSDDGSGQGGDAITDSNGYFEILETGMCMYILRVMLIMIFHPVHLDTLQ